MSFDYEGAGLPLSKVSWFNVMGDGITISTTSFDVLSRLLLSEGAARASDVVTAPKKLLILGHGAKESVDSVVEAGALRVSCAVSWVGSASQSSKESSSAFLNLAEHISQGVPVYPNGISFWAPAGSTLSSPANAELVAYIVQRTKPAQMYSAHAEVPNVGLAGEVTERHEQIRNALMSQPLAPEVTAYDVLLVDAGRGIALATILRNFAGRGIRYLGVEVFCCRLDGEPKPNHFLAQQHIPNLLERQFRKVSQEIDELQRSKAQLQQEAERQTRHMDHWRTIRDTKNAKIAELREACAQLQGTEKKSPMYWLFTSCRSVPALLAQKTWEIELLERCVAYSCSQLCVLAQSRMHNSRQAAMLQEELLEKYAELRDLESIRDFYGKRV